MFFPQVTCQSLCHKRHIAEQILTVNCSLILVPLVLEESHVLTAAWPGAGQLPDVCSVSITARSFCKFKAGVGVVAAQDPRKTMWPSQLLTANVQSVQRLE